MNAKQARGIAREWVETNRDRWPAMVLGVLAIYLVVAADRARSS